MPDRKSRFQSVNTNHFDAAQVDNLTLKIKSGVPSLSADANGLFVQVGPGGVIAHSEKAANDGVATLDANGKIPVSQLPALAITDVYVVADDAARDALETSPVVQMGDVAIVANSAAAGNVAETYIWVGNDSDHGTPGDWQVLDTAVGGASGVTSVIAGNGLTGGGTGTVTLHVATGAGITINSDQVVLNPSDLLRAQPAEIDGDKIDIDWNPTYYTPAAASPFSSHEDELTSHLKGIDNAICRETVNEITIGTNGPASTPIGATVRSGMELVTKVVHNSGGMLYYGDDYTVTGGNTIVWSAGMQADLKSGDKIRVYYYT